MDIVLFLLIVENFITIRNFFNFYYCVNISTAISMQVQAIRILFCRLIFTFPAGFTSQSI